MTTPEQLDRLAADYWDAYLERNPTYATAIGDHRFDHALEDESPAAIDAWRQKRPPVTTPSKRAGGLTVSPVLGKDVRGVVASIRF